VQPDGKILVAGEFTDSNGTGRNRITRLNADGSLDTGFDPGTGADGIVRSVTLRPDGRIIVGGSFSSMNGIPRTRLARLEPNGTLATTFDPGTGANSTVRSIALQADGKIILGGGLPATTTPVATASPASTARRAPVSS